MKRKLLALLLALVLSASAMTGCGSEKAKDDVTTQDVIEDVVYITDTGTKYHADGCRYLSQSCHEIDRQEAEDKGYEPCSVCNP